MNLLSLLLCALPVLFAWLALETLATGPTTDFLPMDAQRVPVGDTHSNATLPKSRRIGGPIQENTVLRKSRVSVSLHSVPGVGYVFSDATADKRVVDFFAKSLTRAKGK